MSGIINPEWLAAHPGFLKAGRQRSHGDKFRGYGGTPGRGPAGETCRSCRNYAHNHGSEGRSSKGYPKCWLMEPIWTNGPGTDIKARSPACEKWEPRLGKKSLQEIDYEEKYQNFLEHLKSRKP